jgi:8-oxo-dGTP diphosphatase
MAGPQFGLAEAGRSWPDRPSVFGIARRGGRIALVEIGDPSEKVWLALPGGGLEPGESPEGALVREFAEETGLVVRPGVVLGESSDRVIINAGRAFNVRGRFFTVRLVREEPGRLTEPDHRLVWRTPLEAIRTLHRQSHAWAVVEWLRGLQAAGGHSSPALGQGRRAP